MDRRGSGPITLHDVQDRIFGLYDTDVEDQGDNSSSGVVLRKKTSRQGQGIRDDTRETLFLAD